MNLAKTNFVNAPSQETAVVDVYGTNATATTDPINNFKEAPTTGTDISGFLPSNAEDPFKGMGLLNDDKFVKAVGKLESVIRDPKAFAKSLGNDLAKDVFASVGYTGDLDGVIATIKDPEQLKANALAALATQDEVKVLINGVESVIKNNDLSTANGIAAAISELTGNTTLLKITQISPMLSMVKSLVDNAMRLNLPGAVDALIDVVEDSKERNRLKLNSVLSAASNSDLDFIRSVFDDEDIGVSKVRALYPNLIQVLLSSYRLRSEKDFKAETKKLEDILNRFNSRWYLSKRAGAEIIDISTMSAISNDAVKALSTNPKLCAIVNAAKSVRTQTDLIAYTLSNRVYAAS